MSKKIGFWSVFAIVTGSQIGTTIFMSPATLVQYGVFGLIGWLISGLGAIAICLILANLCSHFPQTGGPHVYVNQAFGRTAAFFTGWTYWIISWISTTVVIVTAIGSLSPLLGDIPKITELGLQISLLLLITTLNLRGIQIAGFAELVLMLMKFIPLVIIPTAALFHFDSANFSLSPHLESIPISSILSQVTLMTFFGFIGLECATTPADDVHEPSKTIPKAIVIGTSCVALLYLLNSAGIIGMVPREELMNSKAPYVDATRIIFGGNWHLLISIIASIVCVGTLNAWMLASGQTILGLAQDRLMPEIFAKKNNHGAPTLGILVSCAGIIPLLILTINENLASQINMIIDFSVTAFLFVYLCCCFSFLKLAIEKRKEHKTSLWHFVFCFIAISFCSWVIYKTDFTSLLVAISFVLSGLPIYFLWYRKNSYLKNET